MISFTICLLVLVAGYFVYGRFVERVFGPDNNRLTPALTRQMVWIIFLCLPGRFL